MTWFAMLACSGMMSPSEDTATPEDVWMPTLTETSPPPPPPPPDCEVEGPASGPPEVDIGVSPHTPFIPEVTVRTSEPAQVAVYCTIEAEPEEALLWESRALTNTHQILLSGMRPGEAYACAATATCPEPTPGASAFTITSSPAPERVPDAQVIRHPDLEPDPATPHLVINHKRGVIADSTHRLLVYDLDGDLRWFYGLPRNAGIAIGIDYVGNGQFVWGGDWNSPGSGAELVNVSHALDYKAQFEGSATLTFHHEARMLADGTLLMVTAVPNRRPDGTGASWEGFAVWVVDPSTDELVWSWNSQRGVDAGILPVGEDDVYHINAADIVATDEGPLLVLSLCFWPRVVGVDVATGDIRWVFGPNGDFDAIDLAGDPLPDTEFPDCQHGIEMDGNRLLVYDNGRYFRGYSRATEWILDPALGQATQTWAWTEPDWFEPGLGDIDELSADRVSITQAHGELWSGSPGDLSAVIEVDRPTGEVVWRHQFLDIEDTSYRSERFDGCEIFPQAEFCPHVAARLSVLTPLLDTTVDLPTDPGPPAWPVLNDAGIPAGAAIYTWDGSASGGPAGEFEQEDTTCPTPPEGTLASRIQVGAAWEGNGNYAGFGVFTEKAGVDLTGYTSLNLALATEADPARVKLEMTAAGTKHIWWLNDVIDTTQWVSGAWTEVSLPVDSATIDLSDVTGLVLITGSQNNAQICVDDVRYE